jgi:hypothetical protein
VSRRAVFLVLAVAAAAGGCLPKDSVFKFPRFTEAQSEWLQTHCRVTGVTLYEGQVTMPQAKEKLQADVVERLASSNDEVQLVGYRCPEPVPAEIARGEEK